jgi:V/A-type H+-transporting ATPase subunit B
MDNLSKLHETQKRLLAGREYIGVDRIDGPLVFLKNTHPVGYRELVECVDREGHTRLGMVLDTSDTAVVAQVFEGTSGLTMPDTSVRFKGEPLSLGVSTKMLGRVMNGLGMPIDEGPAPCPKTSTT